MRNGERGGGEHGAGGEPVRNGDGIGGERNGAVGMDVLGQQPERGGGLRGAAAGENERGVRVCERRGGERGACGGIVRRRERRRRYRGTGPWNWVCDGTNGGMNSGTCTAPLQTAAVNGACGTANGQTLGAAPVTGLCAAGTATGVSGTGPWTWVCDGLNGGTTATCEALKTEAGL